MSRYAPVNPADSPPESRTTTPRRSLASRRPSMSSFRFGSSSNVRDARLPDPTEMDAAFEGPDDEDESGETHGLLRSSEGAQARDARMPGDYDFERDYTRPPSPPPFQPYSHHHPAPGNTNGLIPTDPVARPSPRHFLGGLLPSSFLPRQSSPAVVNGRVVGAGNAGVFNNLSARPDGQAAPQRDEGDFVPETEQKEGPPSYQAALRDAVPPYWDTTVVLPSSSSPFGPLSSSISGDEILIDGMPSGNFFSFFWNVVVSFSFQFIGFLLTYILHTTHAAKYGSRVGLGITLIQFGFGLRTKAEELIRTGHFPSETEDPADPPITDPIQQDEIAAENALKAYLGTNSPWPQPIRDPLLPPGSPPVILHNTHEAELYAIRHNTTLVELLGLPTAVDVGRANEYFSFLLMAVGWFLILTSLGGLWRVKRFERGLKAAQRESEAAQAAAAAQRDGTEPTITSDAEPITTSTSPSNDYTSLSYYTRGFRDALQGASEIRRGFFGMRGRPVGGQNGHAPLAQDDEHELLDAQGFGLEPMAASGDEARSPRRPRGLWGV